MKTMQQEAAEVLNAATKKRDELLRDQSRVTQALGAAENDVREKQRTYDQLVKMGRVYAADPTRSQANP